MNQVKQSVGLHVRLHDQLHDLVDVVQKLSLPVVQSFLLSEQGSYVELSDGIVHSFSQIKKKLAFEYFVHAAYWSNLSRKNSKEFLSLCKESEIARDLGSDGIVIHIGATRSRLEKWDQARFVAEALNELLHKVADVSIILENSPHAGRNFGGDIADFALLLQEVTPNNRIQFCLDTAHAFVYGYELTNSVKYQDFINLVTESIGVSSIRLLHLNEAAEACGSFIDKHGIVGQGYLGQSVLQKVKHEPIFAQSSIILELPGSCSFEQETAILNQVQKW